MAVLSVNLRRKLEAVAGLIDVNPFLPERVELERIVLGARYRETRLPWNLRPGEEDTDPNLTGLRERAEQLVVDAHLALREATTAPTAAELDAYEFAVHFVLYHRFDHAFTILIDGDDPGAKVDFYDDFHQAATALFRVGDTRLKSLDDLPHVFAIYYQLRRAFHYVFHFIVGVSQPTARLRAVVWQSIFTHDLRRYRRSLFKRMGEFSTMIRGPSGSGKELVARAVGLSRYVAFDTRKRAFRHAPSDAFVELNLSAFAPTLIESELFGHRRGAFTGAVDDRKGWLEVCPREGTVFLDEIGELDPAIQVKLLRVLQERTFQRAGETTTREFHGKIVVATHRDLERAMHEGRFRDDLYYRLCADVIDVPGLAERVFDDATELDALLFHFALREVGADEAEGLAAEVRAWILEHLGTDYAWPGNVRELEQCVRNVLIRKTYRPAGTPVSAGPHRTLADDVAAGRLTVEALLARYTTLVYVAADENLVHTAERLGVDRRTVKARLDADALEAFRGQGGKAAESAS